MSLYPTTHYPTAILLAGVPSENPALYHRVRFAVGDPAAWISLPGSSGAQSVFIVRDIELQRAKASAHASQIACPADFAPTSGLSGDRATATAQAVAECLLRNGVQRVTTDRTLPYIYAWHIQQVGISLEYSPELGVIERRAKDEQEIDWLSKSQTVTEEAILMACQTVARATASGEGLLLHEGSLLTSERLRQSISIFLLNRGFSNHHDSIVASAPHTADCHDRGSGPLKTGQAVIIDIFPQDMSTRYWGDCTRTVVHGDVPDHLRDMHRAVVAAKSAACEKLRAGESSDSVHAATKEMIGKHGYRFARGEIADDPVMPHGTGHGIGLDVHEPILLDDGGGTLLEGEVFTVEPGLYSRNFGGVRVEDMLLVTKSHPKNLNRLPEGLNWK